MANLQLLHIHFVSEILEGLRAEILFETLLLVKSSVRIQCFEVAADLHRVEQLPSTLPDLLMNHLLGLSHTLW